MRWRNFRSSAACLTITVLAFVLAGTSAARSQQPKEVSLIPVDGQVLTGRTRQLAETYRERGQLIAYIDCGSQKESAEEGDVKIRWLPGNAYQFPGQVEGVPATQSSVAFDGSRVVFDLSGLNPRNRYEIGLTWWDYDNGGRTQMVTVGSIDGRNIHLAVPAIRLPNYKDDQQRPAEKRFRLPVTLARGGKMRLVVQQVTGANAVISELWVGQLK